jgi:hypothetical protein
MLPDLDLELPQSGEVDNAIKEIIKPTDNFARWSVPM